MKKFYFLFFIFLVFLISSVSAVPVPCVPDYNVGDVITNRVDDVFVMQYCGNSGKWHDLKPVGKPCENNYECKNQRCIEGHCITKTGILKKYYLPDEMEVEDATTTATTTPTTSGGGGSSGGGGRSISLGSKSSVVKRLSSVSADRSYSLNINELPIPLTKISFISDTKLSSVEFDIKAEDNLDSSISRPKGLIYRYFTIDKKNIQDSNLEKANIEFRVTKDWLSENKLKDSKIILQRYTTSWKIIKSQVIAEDNLYVYYSAVVPGFSWFAATSMPKKPSVAYVPVQQSECGDGIIDPEENCDNCGVDVVCNDDEVCSNERCVIKEKEKSKLWVILVIIVLLVIGFFVYMKFKSKPSDFELESSSNLKSNFSKKF